MSIKYITKLVDEAVHKWLAKYTDSSFSNVSEDMLVEEAILDLADRIKEGRKHKSSQDTNYVSIESKVFEKVMNDRRKRDSAKVQEAEEKERKKEQRLSAFAEASSFMYNMVGRCDKILSDNFPGYCYNSQYTPTHRSSNDYCEAALFARRQCFRGAKNTQESYIKIAAMDDGKVWIALQDLAMCFDVHNIWCEGPKKLFSDVCLSMYINADIGIDLLDTYEDRTEAEEIKAAWRIFSNIRWKHVGCE